MRISLFIFGFILIGSSIWSQSLIQFQSFENDEDSWSFTVAPAPFSDPDAVWNILQVSQLPLPHMPADGNKYWGVKDLSSTNGTSSWGSLSFAAVDLNEYEDVVISFCYECVGFDSGDDLKYQLKINGFLQPEVLLIDGYNNLSVYDSVLIVVPDSATSLEFTISIKQNGTTDYAGIDRIRLIGNIIIPHPEPSEYPGNLHQTTAFPQGLGVSWNEAEGIQLPDFWLLQLTENQSFTDPIDGVEFPADNDLSDGNLAIKLSAETLSYQFYGLNPSTTYSLRIIPYSNSGSLANYKIDEDIPEIQASTFNLNSIFFSEISDPQDNISARFIELFNSSDYDLNFAQPAWYLCKQTNGGSWSCVSLQGSIESLKTYTVANSALAYQEVYGNTPGQSSSTVVSGNGNDAYALYYNGNQSSGILVDIYGVINEDGLGTTWDYTDKQAVRKLNVSQASSTYQPAEWVIDLSTAANCHPDFYGAIFTGTSNQYWHDAENWKPGPPPTNGKVWIRNSAQYDPVILMPQSLADLRLDHLRHLKGHHLLSLSGKFIASCMIPGWNEEELGWKLLSAPNSESSIPNSDFTSDGYDFYWYDEQQHLWLNQKNLQNSLLFDEFIPGRSYLVAYDTSRIRLFAGNLITDPVLIDNLSFSNQGWHLLGNPYPAPILWNNFNWDLNGISPYAYRLSASGNSYELLFPGDTIQKFEGFWVKAGQANASVTIPLETVNFQKEQKLSRLDEQICLKLITTDNVGQKCWVAFYNDASPSYDYTEDALYMNPIKNSVPKFYIQDSDSLRLSLSAQPFDKHKPVRIIAEGTLHQQVMISVTFGNIASHYKSILLKNHQNQSFFLPDEYGNFIVSIDTSHLKHEFDLYFDRISEENTLHIRLPVIIGQSSFDIAIRGDEIPQKIQLYDLLGRLVASSAWPEIPQVSTIKKQFLLLVLTTNHSQYSRSILIGQ